jgi:hypothetical protein
VRIHFLGVLLLAGCAVLQPATDQVDAVVKEVVAVTSIPAPEQKATLARVQQQFAADSSPVNRLRLATLLASLAPPLGDDARAAELLEPLAEAKNGSFGRFAALLATQIAERQRVAREVDRLSKERTGLERERQERDKREEALRAQLEALRSIERGILDREERLRRKPGARQ